MADIIISLSNVHNVKTLHIDEIGDFKVRQLGAGESLDLSDRMRRLDAILTELKDIDLTSLDQGKEEDVKELKRISDRAQKLSDEINEIQRFELDTYKRCFTDDNGGKSVNLLIDSLTQRERAKLFEQIFPPLKKIEEPATEDTLKPVEPSPSPSTKA